MSFFKKHKPMVILSIIICGLVVMWGVSFVIKEGRGALLIERLKNIFVKKTAIPPSEKAMSVKGKRAEQGFEEIIPAKVMKVAKMDYRDAIISFGTIKGFGEIPIRFKESGRISKFYFKEGDEIKKGSIVVSQEQEEENIKLEYAKIEYDKNKKLYELGAITQDKLKQAELELQRIQLGVEKRNFYAPSDGFMGTRKVDEGELVDPNDVVATFLDIRNVYCEVGIIERDIGKVKVGQEVKLTLETFPRDVYTGIVDSVSPMVEGRSRTQTVRILVPNEKYLIKPGMFAKAEITTFEKKDAVVVPKKALKKRDEGYVVFGVVRDKKGPKKTQGLGFEEAIAKSISVKVERATEEFALISEGLTEGEEIVLESPQSKADLEDGARIEIIEGIGGE